MRIAVASKDGKVINQHFGHAERFLIYEAQDSEIQFLEERKVERYCSASGEDLYDQERCKKILDSLSDCSLLLVTKIGARPEIELQRRGIKTIMMYDWIEEGIKKAVNCEQGSLC